MLSLREDQEEVLELSGLLFVYLLGWLVCFITWHGDKRNEDFWMDLGISAIWPAVLVMVLREAFLEARDGAGRVR